MKAFFLCTKGMSFNNSLGMISCVPWICLKLCVWIRSGKTCESESVWFFSGECRASDMVGQWGRAEGRGDCHSRLLHEIQNLLHELWKWSHNLNYRIILFREIEKSLLRGKHLLMFLIVVSWDTSCLGRHSLGLPLLRNLFSFVGPQGSRLSQGSIFPDSRPLLLLLGRATVPTFLPFWQQPLQLEVAVVGRGKRDFSVKLSLSIAFATSVERYVFT